MDASLTIGEVARRAGVRPSAIRFYERHGVLPEPVRVSGQRRYAEDVVQRLAAIDIAKRAGFSLAEAKQLLAAADRGGPAPELRELAEGKLLQVEALIARAEAMRAWLELARGCGCATLEECGLFTTGPG
jgi:MerR family transcriptional regulator, redox-sensitive transcriptional activator SoxR